MKRGYLNTVKSLIYILFFVTTTCYAQLAKDKCKFLGNIISGSTPPDFATYWNQVTPENAGKWQSVEATRDVMTWDQLDNAYKTAKDNGMKFKQHTFLWGQQQPTWLAALSAEEQKEEVEEWIKAFAERYPDADYIDVVNEPLHETPVYANALGGKGTTGWDWVIWGFEKAREYCPNAKLILNDYNIINNTQATNDYLKIITLLKDRGLIDYIGEQGHFLETTPNSTLTGNLDKLAATGLPILISEYDVNIANDADQRVRYESQFPALWGHYAVQGITLWGYRQNEIWRTDAYLVRSNGSARPALDWLKTYVKENAGGCVTTGLNDENSRFKVYPNPSSGTLFIESNSEFVICDLLGRKLMSGAGSTSVNLTSGFYLVKTDGDAQKVIVK